MNVQQNTTTQNLKPNPTDFQVNYETNKDTKNDLELLKPETVNEINKAVEDKTQEKKDFVSNTYDVARNIDLSKISYNQKQAVIDAYLAQTEHDAHTHSQLDNSDSATQRLSEMYAALYEARQNEGNVPKPEPVSTQPVNELEPEEYKEPIEQETNKVEIQTLPNQKQIDSYNSLAFSSQSSYMHVTA